MLLLQIVNPRLTCNKEARLFSSFVEMAVVGALGVHDVGGEAAGEVDLTEHSHAYVLIVARA